MSPRQWQTDQSQSAFVPSRATTDNILISNEILHILIWKNKANKGFAALKVDMAEAYGRVEWGFPKYVMQRMGFHAEWIQLILTSITTMQLNVLYGGKEIGPIIPPRGLKQGDPLSPYLVNKYPP